VVWKISINVLITSEVLQGSRRRCQFERMSY
jgi:hypothetical protein